MTHLLKSCQDRLEKSGTMDRAAFDLFINALAWASEEGQTSTANGVLLIKPTGISHLFHKLKQCLRSIKKQPALQSCPLFLWNWKETKQDKGTKNICHRSLNDSYLTLKLLFQVQQKCTKNWINIEFSFKVTAQTINVIFKKCIAFFEIKVHHYIRLLKYIILLFASAWGRTLVWFCLWTWSK